MSQEDKKKDITIYDLASELKISASTVSRALNDHFSIGAETKKAVRKLAKEKGYRTNVIASSLRTNKSSTIGIMVTWINRPFISSLIAGAEKAAKEAGYQVIITQTHDDIEMEKANLKML
ncbi:MAG TPA: LacI family DNA-binding transcriptional regulator, partial [Saprospiraceae bacterium]|nr:LacI family DNA-binding transcriptional regulator [Saprospiraceae bacterium]